MESSNVTRQRRFAEKMQQEGNKKYSFWMGIKEAELVKALVKEDGPVTASGLMLNEMLSVISDKLQCDNAAAVRMAITRMYASLVSDDGSFDYPSDEARIGLAAIESNEVVVSSKTLADILSQK